MDISGPIIDRLVGVQTEKQAPRKDLPFTNFETVLGKVADFVGSLPGKAIEFMQSLPGKAREFKQSLSRRAQETADRVYMCVRDTLGITDSGYIKRYLEWYISSKVIKNLKEADQRQHAYDGELTGRLETGELQEAKSITVYRRNFESLVKDRINHPNEGDRFLRYYISLGYPIKVNGKEIRRPDTYDINPSREEERGARDNLVNDETLEQVKKDIQQNITNRDLHKAAIAVANNSLYKVSNDDLMIPATTIDKVKKGQGIVINGKEQTEFGITLHHLPHPEGIKSNAKGHIIEDHALEIKEEGDRLRVSSVSKFRVTALPLDLDSPFDQIDPNDLRTIDSDKIVTISHTALVDAKGNVESYKTDFTVT